MILDGTVIIPLMTVAAAIVWLIVDRPKNGRRRK